MKLSKSSIITIGISAFLILSYVYMIMIKHYPWYYLVILYIVVLAIGILVFFSAFIAILGNYNYALGKQERARKFLSIAIEKNTKSPMAYLNYAILLLREGEGKKALDLLNRALSLKPKAITVKNIKLTMGSCYWVMGDSLKAIEVLEEMRSTYDYVNGYVLTTLAYMYLINNDTDKAMLFTKKALEEAPESAAAWDNLGQIYYKLQDTPKAEEAFEKAIGYKNDLADSYFYLALIAEEKNEKEKALEYIEKASTCNISALNTVTKEQVEAKLYALSK